MGEPESELNPNFNTILIALSLKEFGGILSEKVLNIIGRLVYVGD